MSKPWELNYSDEQETGAKPWEVDYGSDEPEGEKKKPRTFTEKAADMARTFGAAGVNAVGGIPKAVGRAVAEGGEKLLGLSMDEARRLAEADGTPERALEYYEKANRLNPVSRAGGVIEALGDATTGLADSIRAGRSQEATQAIQDSTPKGDITSPSTWQAPANPSIEGALGVMVEGAGSMVPAVASAIATRGQSAETQMKVGAGSAAAQVGGAAMDEANKLLAGMSDDELSAASPVFRNLIEKGYKPEQARTLLTRDAENRAATFAAPAGAMGGAATSAILGKWGERVAAGAMLPARAAVLAALGATEEGIQEVAEGVATRAGINDATGMQRSLTEGTVEEFVMGAAGGGPVAGGRAVVDSLAKRIEQGENPGQDLGTPGARPGQDLGTPSAAQVAQPVAQPVAQVAQPEAEEAAKALRTVVSTGPLERADEIDGELSRLAEREAELTPENGYGPTFDVERQEIAQRRQALAAERDQLAQAWPKTLPGAPTSFSTEAGVRLEGQYALVEADDLVTSHDESLRPNPRFPSELQPRDRTRQASELQVSSIVQRLDPARLGVSADSATGAPIIGKDGLVESGNARTIALKRVYQANGQKAEDYKTFLRQNAQQFGIAPESIDGMRRPVLVRVRNTPVNRAEFARQANQSTIQRMAPAEQALSDAKRLSTLEGLDPDENGDFSSNFDFIRQFMAGLPVTEQGGMLESDGRLSTEGYRRIQNAVLAKAYGDSPTLRRMTESRDDNLRNVSKALLRVAPRLAEARERIDAGTLNDADITGDLLAAVEGLSALRERGWSVDDELGQSDLTGPKYTEEAADLLRFLADNLRAPRRIAEFLQRYYEALEQAGDPSQATMFDDGAPAPTRRDLLGRAKGDTNADDSSTRAAEGPGSGAQTGAPSGQQRQAAPGDQEGNQGDGPAAADAGAQQPRTAEQGSAESWVMFPPESGTLGIPRSQMPQVKARDRAALVQFLAARGINYTIEEDADPNGLKPTQAEYSPSKAESFAKTGDKDRSVLVSREGHVLDGHHQWMGAQQAGSTIKVIRFDAPIRDLMAATEEFPSVQRSEGSPDLSPRDQAVQEFKAAMADLADIATKYTRATMLPESTPGLMPTLVRLFSAAIKVVGTDLKAATRYVKEQLKANPDTKKIWNRIAEETYRKAAVQALEAQGSEDLLAGSVESAPQDKVPMIDGRPYDPAKDNFVPPAPGEIFDADLLKRADGFVDKYYKDAPEYQMEPDERAVAERLLAPFLEKAKAAKNSYDQKIIDIAQEIGALGQQLAPIKKLKRAAEKMHQDSVIDKKPLRPEEVKDFLRSTIVVSTYEDALAAVDAIEKRFEIFRVKDKHTPDARNKQGGYADVTVFVKLDNGLIAEIQLNVPSMLTAKADQGHKLYEAARNLPFESDLAKEIMGAMRELYDAAFDLAWASQPLTPPLAKARDDSAAAMKPASDIGAPERGPLGSMPGSGTSDSPSGEGLNQRPSGNRTNSSPEKSATKRQPGGKESGNFISEPRGDIVARPTVNGYTQPNLFGDDDANTQSGQGGAQGSGAGAAGAAGSAGSADGVRAGKSQRDRQPGGDDDAGRSRAREVGQPGSDGVRGEDAGGGRAQPRDRAGRGAGVPAGRDVAPKSGRNYVFGPDDLTYEGSWAKKAEANVAAVELLRKLEAEKRQATPEEQKILAKFVGWGASEVANNLFGPKSKEKDGKVAAYLKAREIFDGGTTRIDRYSPSYWDVAQPLMGRSAMRYGDSVTPDMVTLANYGIESSDVRYADLRKRLAAALTEDELAEARRSTQYAHYTSKAVVQSMWKAVERMGFKGGSVLEPGAGIGVFPGLMPPAMANNSTYTGIEFDSITGGILKQLFPDERILVESFVDSKLPKNFYDVAVGNPPFSGTKILSDPEYAKRAFTLHDYFFAKSIDRVKPGGLVVYVTSRYTMDKLDDKARAYLADRADLVGAIRLPQTAFKQNAGTEVVTDVIFLRKKVPGETFEGAQAWAKSVPVKVGKETFNVNEYFAANPDMVLGTPAATGSMYSSNEYTVEPLAGNIEDHFAKAIERLPENIYKAPRGSDAEAAQVREIDFNPKAKKEGNYYVTDAGVLMQREAGVGQRVELRSQKDVELIKDFIPLRDALKQAHYDQLNDGPWEDSLRSLQSAYAAFTKKHGQINQFTSKVRKVKTKDEDTGEEFTDETLVRSFPILDTLKNDPDYTLVAALEKLNDDTGEITPSDFLTKRVLAKPAPVDLSNPADALLATLNDLGKVDIDVIAARTGLSRADVIETLGTAVYEDPEQGWQTYDQYLSGNVKAKLEIAREAAKQDRRFERNVTALEAVQPAPKTPAQISVGLGMNWIPGAVYEAFLKETAGVTARVEFNQRTRQWIVDEKSGGATLKATADWGTGSRNATELLEHALTGRPIRITRTIGTGADQQKVFDADATEAANQKLEALRTEFASWIWRDAKRTDRLVQIYNDKFNTTVPRSFDGRHLSLPGTSTAFKVFDHVKRGAWRIIQQGNTYLAHAVGSGKTFQMVIAAMEQKRLGLVKKPMIVVPNHMLQQFASEWQQLYPAARLMVADENNFHTDNRRRFVSRVALSDLDGVIITHSAFKLLDLDPEFKKQMIEEQLDYMRAALEEAGGKVDDSRSAGGFGTKKKSGSRDPKIKQIERQIEAMEQKLEAAMSSEGKDKNVRFDELGVDFLMVDEAHEYRKLDFTTTRDVKGISPAGSAKAFDLYMKSQYLERKTPGRSLVMASGTPITNTVAELFTVQKFMAGDVLRARGLEDFDSWAAMFGRERVVLEPNAAGKYEPVTRFTKFVNVPELTQMFRDFADVVTSDELAKLLGDKRPKVKGGSRKITTTPKTPEYAAYQKELSTRVEISRRWKPSKDQPNNPDPMIRIIGDGRLAAIDHRFVMPGAPNNPDTKLNKLIDRVIEAYKESADLEYRDKKGEIEPNKGASMMVFSDLGFGAGVAESRGFNARAWFEKRLRDAGVDMKQVAFMSDYKKSTDKLKLFKDVNAGRVRILVGSSKNMGTGVNAQQRLLYEFHLDSPWYPADMEQREGRAIRQGNKNPEVNIEAFAAKGTYDENMWKLLASKQYFIDQALSGDESVRELDDLDSMSQFDLAAALSAEDPRVLQLAGARAEVEKLNRLYGAHEEQRFEFRRRHAEAKMTVDFARKRMPEAEKDAARVQDVTGDKFKAKIGKATFTDRAEFGQALIDEFGKFVATGATGEFQAGEISGFPIVAQGEKIGETYRAFLSLRAGQNALLTSTGEGVVSPIGVAMRAQNALQETARLPGKLAERIREAESQMDALAGRLDAPFPMAQMLADKRQEVRDIEEALAAEGRGKTFRVERKATGEGFDVTAANAAEAIEKAVATNGGAPEEWVAKEEGEKKPADDTRLSRGSAAPGGQTLSVPQLQEIAQRVRAGMPNMPEVVVLSDASKAPKALREYIEAQGAMQDVEGAMHDGRLYLFASGLGDPLRAEHVLAEHEAAHFGLRAILGSKLPGAMSAIYEQNATVRRAVNRLREGSRLSLTEAVEEVIVDMPTSELARMKGWRRVVSLARDALAKMGFERMAAKLGQWLDGTLSDQERADLFVADLVRSAREYVAGRRPAVRTLAADTRLSGRLADDLAEQEKWLQAEARARGFKDIEDLLAQDYPLFEKLAALWRQKNPADTLLSRRKEPTERAEDLLAKKAATAAPLDAITRAVTRVTGIERLTGAIYDRAAYLLDRYTPEQIKAGIVSDYGVPEAVMDQRVQLQARQRVQLRKAGNLIDKLSTLTREESRVAYEWMNMDGTDPRAYVSMMQGLPEESVKVLQDVQKMIDDLSREAVRLGQLSPEAFERNRFAYLRRSYAKHILEQTAADKAKRARVLSILGDQYKGRGLTEAADMDKIKAAAPEWWGRKLQQGKGDAGLKGQKFIRLERREGNGAGTKPLEGMDGKGVGKLREIAYWPADEKIPAKYAEWGRAGTFEVRDVKGPKLILWRDFTKEEREKMGEVDEARFAIAKTLHGMIHDVEVGRYLEWMSHTQAKKEGEEIPGAEVQASEGFLRTFKPGEWVKVPETKITGTSVHKYGKLAGRYVPGPVWNDIRQVVNGRFKVGEAYDAVLTAWKISKTALSPAVHMNNIMSNFVMADWHGVTAGHVAKSLSILLGASKREGRGLIGRTGNLVTRAGIADAEAAREILARYQDSGGDAGSWVTSEIATDQLEPLLEKLEKELAVSNGTSQAAETGIFAALQHALMLRFPSAWEAFKPTLPGRVVYTEGKSLIDLYQHEDDVFRLAAWLAAKERGESDIEAGRAARRSFLDYNINAPWIAGMRATAWPFISFTYRAVPMLLEVAGKRPHKLMKLMMVAGALNALGMALAGGDEDDEERARKLLPEEKAGKVWGIVPKLIRMPWNDDHGSPVYLDIRRYIPVGDVFDVNATQAAIPVLPGLMPGGPVVIMGEIVANKSMFTGKEITKETDTGLQQVQKVVDHLYKAFMPNIVVLPNTYAFEGVAGSLTGRTDAFGRELSTPQALASAFGVKLGSYPADVLQRNQVARHRALEAQIQMDIAGLKRQYQTGRLSREEFDEAIKVEQDKLRELNSKLTEKMR